MALDLRAPAVTAALLAGILLGFGPSFVPLVPKGVGSASPPVWAPASRGASLQAASGVGRAQPRCTGVAAAAVALLAAAALRSRREAARRSRSGCVVVELPGTSGAAIAGATLTPAPEQRGLVARRSLYSCYNLYFKRGGIYKDRARREIRNRAYNIYMKNKYKKAMKRVLRYTVELEFGDADPGSLAKVMEDIKPLLDEACLTIDEVCTQGVIHRNTAARRKDRMCRAILRGSVVKGYIEQPKDPFEPAYQTLGYKMPKSNKLREPRPWQLPGWKSPWMLRREFNKWRKLRPAEAEQEA